MGARGGPEISDGPLEPAWPLRFLVALSGWRLRVPAGSGCGGGSPSGRGLCRRGFAELGDVLGLGRMLSLLPFFVLALLQPRHLSALTVVVSLVAAVPAAHYVDCAAWFSWRSSLVDRGIDPLGLGLLSRSGCMLAALALTLALRPG